MKQSPHSEMTIRKIALLTAFVLSSCAPAAANGPKCGERDPIIKVLSGKYKEKPSAMGLSARGTAMFEVYTSASGTWTIVMTTTAGATCIMAAGHSWETIIKKLGDGT